MTTPPVPVIVLPYPPPESAYFRQTHGRRIRTGTAERYTRLADQLLEDAPRCVASVTIAVFRPDRRQIPPGPAELIVVIDVLAQIGIVNRGDIQYRAVQIDESDPRVEITLEKREP